MNPRVLSIDVETAPAKVYTFGPVGGRPVFVTLDQVIEHDRMICFAAKWLGESKVAFSSEYHHGKEAMLAACFSLLDEADAVVTYNGDRFDTPWMNREFQLAGLGRPSSSVSIDLYKAGKKHFRFLSHKLANLTEQMGLSGKMAHHGFILWRECLGDFGEARQKQAWSIMRRYNKQDVVTTEELYLELLPWLDKHPNMNFYTEEEGCPKCGSLDLEKRGFKATSVSIFQQLYCRSCGSWSRSGKRERGVDIR